MGGSYKRPDDAPGGRDPMLMFFTSGTTSYPKMALHAYTYALGHYVTAKYWHLVEPDGRTESMTPPRVEAYPPNEVSCEADAMRGVFRRFSRVFANYRNRFNLKR